MRDGRCRLSGAGWAAAWEFGERAIQNPKSEIRNKFESPKKKIRNRKALEFRIWVIRICILFRISDFGFSPSRRPRQRPNLAEFPAQLCPGRPAVGRTIHFPADAAGIDPFRVPRGNGELPDRAVL